MQIPFSPPDISDLEIAEVVSAMRSGWITTGPKTKLFEKKIAEYCGTSKAVCLNSATAALEMTLRLLGVGAGDEVITSAYTYTASASVINHVGATIVLVDVAPGSFEMDYEKLADAITENTKVIIPVNIGGVMCNYDLLFKLVESKKHLYRPSNNKYQKLYDRPIIVEDAAHSFGAIYHGKLCGTISDFTAFSFHAVKNLTTAEGGAVTWRDLEGINNDEIYYQYMLYSLHGQSKDAFSKTKLDAWEYDIVYPGYKCNMTDIMAAIGIAQLSRFDILMAKRKYLVKMYDKELLSFGIERLDHYGVDFEGNGHLYLMRIPGITESHRNEIISKMAEAGVATNVHFKPLPMHTAYRKMGFKITDFPFAYLQYANEITLPLHTLMTNDQVEFVIEVLGKILKNDRVSSLSEVGFDIWDSNHSAVQEVYDAV